MRHYYDQDRYAYNNVICDEMFKKRTPYSLNKNDILYSGHGGVLHSHYGKPTVLSYVKFMNGAYFQRNGEILFPTIINIEINNEKQKYDNKKNDTYGFTEKILRKSYASNKLGDYFFSIPDYFSPLLKLLVKEHFDENTLLHMFLRNTIFNLEKKQFTEYFYNLIKNKIPNNYSHNDELLQIIYSNLIDSTIEEFSHKLSCFFFFNEMVGLYLKDSSNNYSIADFFPQSNINGVYEATKKHEDIYINIRKEYDKFNITTHNYTLDIAKMVFLNVVKSEKHTLGMFAYRKFKNTLKPSNIIKIIENNTNDYHPMESENNTTNDKKEEEVQYLVNKLDGIINTKNIAYYEITNKSLCSYVSFVEPEFLNKTIFILKRTINLLKKEEKNKILLNSFKNFEHMLLFTLLCMETDFYDNMKIDNILLDYLVFLNDDNFIIHMRYDNVKILADNYMKNDQKIPLNFIKNIVF